MLRSTQKLSHKIKRAFTMISSGGLKLFFNELKKRWNSQTLSLGLQRDLHIPFKVPEAKIPLNIRQLKPTDADYLLGYGRLKKEALNLYYHQMDTIGAFETNCFVAEDIQGKACYMQFLIGAQHNEKIQNHFGNLFPLLSTEEALLEGAYTHPHYQELDIMPAAMARIAEKAKKSGARWVLTFVDKDDIASLKSCMRAGFSPYILRIDRWFMFRMTTHFEPLNDLIMDEYEQNMGLDGSRTMTQHKPHHNGVLVNGTM